MISFETILLLVFIAVVIVVAWPTCKTGTSRWWLIGSTIAIPWLAWLYWVPRAVRYRLAISALKRRTAAVQYHRDSVRFWLKCQRNGTPIEQAIAPQMLAFLSELAPPGIAPSGLRGRVEPCRCGWCRPNSYILVDPSKLG